MKFETLMLHSLFAACMLICVLTMGAMMSAKPTTAHFDGHAKVAAAAKPIA